MENNALCKLAGGRDKYAQIRPPICETRRRRFPKSQKYILKAAALTNHGRLQIDKDGTRNVLPSAGFAKKGVEGVVSTADGLVGRHCAVRLDAMLQTVQLPTRVTDLHTGLAYVDGYALTLRDEGRRREPTLKHCSRSAL